MKAANFRLLSDAEHKDALSAGTGRLLHTIAHAITHAM
jgi:hypothetical protein